MTELDAGTLRRLLADVTRDRLDDIEVFREIDSTNTYLKKQTAVAPGRIRVAIADHQTAGRGRHDRAWLSKPGGSICLSVAYTFHCRPANLPALTLALGVGAANALATLGVPELRLKWPNDILVAQSKLGGILTESQIRSGSDTTIVAGIGINVDLPELDKSASKLAWAHNATDLHSVMDDPPDRDYLSSAVIDGLFAAFEAYDREGFDRFAGEYEAYDGLSGKLIVVQTPAGEVKGVAAGIDDVGALLVNAESGQLRITTGSIMSVCNDIKNATGAA